MFNDLPPAVQAAYCQQAISQGDPRLPLLARAEELFLKDHLKPEHRVFLALDPDGRQIVQVQAEMLDGSETEWTGVLIPVPGQKAEFFPDKPGAWFAFGVSGQFSLAYLPAGYRLVFQNAGVLSSGPLSANLDALAGKRALLVGLRDSTGALWVNYVQPELAPGRFSLDANA